MTETTVTCALAMKGMKGPCVDLESDHHVHERDIVWRADYQHLQVRRR